MNTEPADLRALPGAEIVRELADAERIRRLADALGAIAPRGTRIHLAGGATAVLEGWREATVDVDLRIEPESEQVMREIPGLKGRLATNIAMLADRLVEPAKLRDLFAAIESELFRFPSIDRGAFRVKLERALR